MQRERIGQTAVIFISRRTGADDADYAAAAEAMAALAAAQPGYAGIDSVRGADGTGITISYWADDASAAAWRDHPEHARIRDAGRARWYERYESPFENAPFGALRHRPAPPPGHPTAVSCGWPGGGAGRCRLRMRTSAHSQTGYETYVTHITRGYRWERP